MKTNRFVVLAIALALSPLATAQTTYKWIDKTTGRTVYSDQPPPDYTGSRMFLRRCCQLATARAAGFLPLP